MKKTVLFLMVAILYMFAPSSLVAQVAPVPSFDYVHDEVIVYTTTPILWDKNEETADFISYFPAGSKVIQCADACIYPQLQQKELWLSGKYYGRTFLVKLPTPDAHLWADQNDEQPQREPIQQVWFNKIGELYSSVPISMNDPHFATSQGHLEYDLVTIGGGVKYSGVHHAYGYVFKNTSKVLVAVLDGGLNFNHQDIQNAWWVNSSEVLNGIDDDGDSYVDNIVGYDFSGGDNNPTDDGTTSHGTHVTGIIAARNNNSNNICGIITDTASVIVLRVANSTGSVSDFTTSSGYYLGLSKGARVMNMSFGFSTVPSSLMTAIATGISTYKAVPIAGVGNTGTTYYAYPASGANVLTVGGTNYGGTTWSSSSLSDSVDIQFPAQNIYSLSATSNTSTILMSGTSMATPGISAMVWRILKADTTLTVAQVAAKVRSRGLLGTFTTGVGWGYFSGIDTLHYNDMKPDSVAFAACSGKKALPFMKQFKIIDSLRFGNYAIVNDSVNTNIIAPGTYTYKVAWKSEPRSSTYYQDTFTCKFTITGTAGTLARDTVKITPDTVCLGTSVTANAYTNYTTSSVPKSWYVNNVFVANNATSYTFTPSVTGWYRVKYVAHLDSTTSCWTSAKDTSTIDSVYVRASVTPTASISVSPNDTVCASTTLNFSSTGSNLGTTPTYQWQRFTTSWGNITGATSSTYNVTAGSLTSGDSIRLQVTSSATCATPSMVTSNAIKIVVKADTTITVTTTPDVSGYCVSGGSSLLTATTNITSPAYQWYLGSSPIVGATSNTHNSTGLASGTYYYHVVVTPTIAGGCYTTSSVVALDDTVTVGPATSPSLSASTTTPTICNENTATITSSISVIGATAQWQRRPVSGTWANIAGATAPTHVTSIGMPAGSYEYQCIYTMPTGCFTQPIDTTPIVTLTVNAPIAPTAITITGGTAYQAMSVWYRDYSVSPSVDVNYYRKVGGVWVFQVFKSAGTPWVHALDVQGDTIKAVYAPSGCYNPDSSTSNILELNSPVSVAAVPGVLREVKLYPNPTTAAVFIAGLPSDSKVAVYSVVGSKVSQDFTAKHGETLSVDLQSLAAGTYSVYVVAPNGERHAYMVVKK